MFRNGQFEMTTASQNNSFVKDGKLYIVPTLTSDNLGTAAVFDQTVYNITGCTFNDTRPDNGFITRNGERVFDVDGYVKACSKVSNATSGAVINPVQSARLSTIKSASIRFGRVEVRAKLPHGSVSLFVFYSILLGSLTCFAVVSLEIGCGLRFGCYQRTVFMDLGL